MFNLKKHAFALILLVMQIFAILILLKSGGGIPDLLGAV